MVGSTSCVLSSGESMVPMIAQFSTARSLTESCSSSASAWNIPIKSALRCSLSSCLANFYITVSCDIERSNQRRDGTYTQISRSSSADHGSFVFAQRNEQAIHSVNNSIFIKNKHNILAQLFLHFVGHAGICHSK